MLSSLTANDLTGPLACLLAAALWAFALTWFRPVIARHGAVPTNVLKCAIALLAFAVFYVLQNSWSLPRGIADMSEGDWLALLTSGLFGMVLADTFGFLAVVRIGAPLSLLIHLASPFVSGLFAWFSLGESITAMVWLGIAVTVTGIGLAIPWRRGQQSQVHGLGVGLLLAFLAMVTNSLAIVWTKPAFEHLDVLPVASMRLFVCIVVLSALQLLRGRGRSLIAPLLDPELRRLLLRATLFGTIGAFYLYNLGIQGSTAGVAAALSGTSPLWAIPVAWWLEGIRPRRAGVFGALVAFTGATWILLHERILQLF